MSMENRPSGGDGGAFSGGYGGGRPPYRPYGGGPGGPPMGGMGGMGGGPGGPPRRTGPGGPRRGRFIPRRKVCVFCVEHATSIDYKNYSMLRRYLSDRAKIEPRRKTGTCAKHQRLLSTALERARHLALLPFTAEQVAPAPRSYSYSERPSYGQREGYGGGQREGPGQRDAASAQAPAPVARADGQGQA